MKARTIEEERDRVKQRVHVKVDEEKHEYYPETEHNETYGQVIFYDGRMLAGMGPGFENGYYGKTKPNCTVIYEVDNKLYKQRLEKR